MRLEPKKSVAWLKGVLEDLISPIFLLVIPDTLKKVWIAWSSLVAGISIASMLDKSLDDALVYRDHFWAVTLGLLGFLWVSSFFSERRTRRLLDEAKAKKATEEQ